MHQAMSALSARRRLIVNAGSLAVGGVLAQAAFMTVEALIARDLGASAYGVFSAVYAWTLLMTFAIDLGMNWKLIEEGARDPATLSVNLGSMLSLKGLIAAFAYPVTLVLLYAFGSTSAVVGLYVMFIPFALLYVVQDSLASVYTATRSNWFNALFQTSVPLTILVAVLLIVRPQPSLTRTSVAFTIGSALPTALWLLLTFRTVRPRVVAARFGSILRGSWLYGMNTLLLYASFKGGVLLLTALSGAREVAFFAAALKFVDLGYKIPVMLNRLIAPQLFADSAHRPTHFPQLCDGLLRATGLLGALTATVLLIAGRDLIRMVFGAEFTLAAALLQILGVSLALKTFALIAQSVITSANQLSFRTKALTITTVLSAVVSVPLILKWGARGAAYGVLVGDVALLIALLWRLHRLLPSTRIVNIAIVPFVATAAAVWLTGRVDLPLIVEVVASAAIVVATLFVLGYLQPVLNLALERSSAREAESQTRA
jgi:O-antigen/teichoic acid export membrane protein